MIGTSTGPSNKPYELENLPDRISPEIPKTLLKGEEIEPSKPDEFNEKSSASGALLRNFDSELDKSEGWDELNLQLNLVAFLRLAVESNTTIIDLAFSDILNECADQVIDCTIPSDRIRVTLTQDVVDRLIKIHTDWAQSASQNFSIVEEGADLETMIITSFSSLLNKEVVLGETHYSQLDGALYSHSVRTSIKRGMAPGDDLFFPRWSDEDVHARWHEDGQVAKFVTSSIDWPLYEYFYQNNVPSELAVVNFVFTTDEGGPGGTYAKLIGNQPEEAGILLEVAAIGLAYASSSSSSTSTSSVSSTAEGSTTQPNSAAQDSEAGSGADNSAGLVTGAEVVTTSTSTSSGYTFNLFQGQMDNSGGYSSQNTYFYDLSENQNLTGYFGFRESYDRIGTLLAGERCISDIPTTVNEKCDVDSVDSYGSEGIALSDSIHYFEPGQFDTLASNQDVIRWKVQGLPAEIQGLGVVAAESIDDVSNGELLCRGLQFAPDDVHVFCTATDEQLDNVIVVELTDAGIPSQAISEASLVQIQ